MKYIYSFFLVLFVKRFSGRVVRSLASQSKGRRFDSSGGFFEFSIIRFF